MNVVMFHQDLRLRDHKPLTAAVQIGPVVPLYIVEPSFWSREDVSIRHFRFVLDSLEDLKHQLEGCGGKLFLFVGELEEALNELFSTYGVFRLFYYEEMNRHDRIQKWMKNHQLPVTSFAKEGYFQDAQNNRQFKKKWQAYINEETLNKPSILKEVTAWPSSFQTELSDLYSYKVHGEKIRFGLQGGETNAVDTLQSFIDSQIDTPQSEHTLLNVIRTSSRLSPYLAWGNVSIRYVVKQLEKAIEQTEAKSLQKLIKHLYERSFTVSISRPFSMYRPFEQSNIGSVWLHGKTGIPIIDAMIRYVMKTGWIDEQSQLVIASFLKEADICESEIGIGLSQLLLDYEPTIHFTNIRRVEKTIHPIKFSKKHDPTGEFIKRNVPELKNVPAQYIHEPWLYPGFFKLQYFVPMVDIYKVYSEKKRTVKENKEVEQLELDL